MAPRIKELVIARQAPLLGQLPLHWMMSVHGATFAHVVAAAEMAHHIMAVSEAVATTKDFARPVQVLMLNAQLEARLNGEAPRVTPMRGATGADGA